MMRDYAANPLQILSMGGGVQSSAMLLMIEEGTLPRPDYVVFSDTGSEMPHTYEHMIEIEKKCQEIDLAFVTVRSHRGKLHEDYLQLGSMPVRANRSCTSNFKILPIRRWARTIVGNQNGVLLCQSWLGITSDESTRAKDPGQPYWAGVTFPLIEMDISRRQCVDILKRHGWEHVRKSGCFCCPFHNMRGWAKLAKDHPDLFDITVEMESRKMKQFGGQTFIGKKLPLTYVTPSTTLTDFGMVIDDEGDDSRSSTCEGFGGCFI